MRLLFCIILIFSHYFVFATAQIPDYLIYKGDTIPIFSNPLEDYFKLIGKRDLMGMGGGWSTACWREYKAIWELKNDSLFLRKIIDCNDSNSIDKGTNLSKLFGTNDVYAYWFTGEIRVPKGKLVQHISMGYASIYEREEILSIKNGQLEKSRLKSNKKIADKIYTERGIDSLAKDTILHAIEKINWVKLDSSDHICDDSYYLDYSRHGKLKKVYFAKLFDSKKERREYYRDEKYCLKIIKRAVKPLRLDYLHPATEFTIWIGIMYNDETQRIELDRVP